MWLKSYHIHVRKIMDEQMFNVGRLLKQINDQLEKNANNNLRDIGLTVTQLTVLRHLFHAPEGRLTMKEVEKKLHVAQSTATGIAMRLELKGLVTARGDESDHRIKVIEITEEGRTVCLKAKSFIIETESRLLNALEEGDRAHFVEMLKNVRDCLVEK